MSFQAMAWLMAATFGTGAAFLALLSGPIGWLGVGGTLVSVLCLRAFRAVSDADWRAEKASWK